MITFSNNNFPQSTFSNFKSILHPKYENFIGNCTVALSAGGEGSRLSNITASQGVNKNALVLPNGETMIERTIRMYSSLGFKQILALVFNQADSIINLLGNGSRFGVEISYSHDPEIAVGRGGAIKNALVNSKIPLGSYLIVHNPDDQIIGDQSAILNDVFNRHLYHEERGGVATAAVVSGAPYQFSGLRVEDSQVKAVEMYPFIPIPAHTGLTVFSPGVYKFFHELFDLNKKTDFESVLFPVLQAAGLLYASPMPLDSWIPVNDEKGLKKLIAAL